MQRQLVWMSAFLALAVSACKSGGATTTMSTSDDAAPLEARAAQASWDFNATIIEACSCPMFCQCYFNARPAGPGCCNNPNDPLLATRYCRFNNAFHVNHGNYNGTKLDGAKFWVAGDLGSEFSDGELDWAVLHFDPSVTKEQRDGIAAILGPLYPAKWTNFSVGADAAVDWKGGKDLSRATLDGGKMGEVVLKRNQGMSDEPIVIHNLKYWGAPRNEGFVLMANEIETYRAGAHPYEFKGTNGFMITVDINSKDAGGGGKSGY